MIGYKKANKYFQEYLEYANEYVDDDIGYYDLPPEIYAALVENLNKEESEDIEYDTLSYFGTLNPKNNTLQ